jgi:trehalose 6-phosphate phosphatase
MDQRSSDLPDARLDWAYFLDLDGTLIDLAATPDAVQVGAPLLDFLQRLHQGCGGAVALISGRSLSDLDQRLGALHMPRAGQHGLERRDAAGRLWLHPAPPAAKQALRQALAPFMARHSGLLLEDKGLTLALHYRQAPHLAGDVHRLMKQLIAGQEENLELQKGKYVVEIKPAGIGKGTAVEEYLREPPFLGRRPVFIGDDLNDEDGFATVNRINGVSVKVGQGKTCARYRLADVTAVRAWLAGATGETT